MVFMFEKDIKKLITNGVIFYDGNLSETKGLSVPSGFWCVNLSANQWNNIDTNMLIHEITKTITHEITHGLISDILNTSFNGEEHVCQVMADQIPEVSFLE